jgi:hypothetical protein
MSKWSSYKEHQLITESWRKFTSEDADLLEEGWKDIAMAGALGLSSLAGPAQAADAPAEPEPVHQVAQSSESVNLVWEVPFRGDLEDALAAAQKGAHAHGALLLAMDDQPENVQATPATEKYPDGGHIRSRTADDEIVDGVAEDAKSIIVDFIISPAPGARVPPGGQ